LGRFPRSHDAACFYDFMVGDPAFAEEKPDYLHISRTILPALLEAGVSQAAIDEMTIANPRRFFESSASPNEQDRQLDL
jgi:phosphotriesterase-related protein